MGEREGVDRVRKSSRDKKKSLQIIPNKNILLVISTKLDIQVNKTNPNKKNIYAFAGPGNHTSSLVQVKTRSDTQQTDKVHIPD